MAFVDPPSLPSWLQAMFPVPHRSYQLERGRDAGKRMHFVDSGPPEGQPVVLFHGNPTWSFLWRKVIAALPEHRCIAADMLGLGLSDRLPSVDDHDVARHAEALAELIEALELHRPIFVGQDWGGPMVTTVGARMTGPVAGIVLANTSVVVPGRPRGTAFHKLARTPMISDVLFRVLGLPERGMALVQGDRRSIRGPVARAYRWPLRRMADRVAPLALARMVPDGPEHPSVPELRRGEDWIGQFEGPMALVWGTRDPILGRALSRHTRTFPEAAVTTTDAGHFLQEEVPEALAAAIATVGPAR